MFTDKFEHVCSSKRCKLLLRAFRNHLLILHEQTGYTAATKLIWTPVIPNGSDASGPFTNGRGIKDV